MYSLVLMSAMSTAPTTAEFNGYFRDLFNRGGCSGCTGCTGCTGATKYNCSGGCCGGSSYSASCTGCCGGSGLFSGDRIRSLFAPTGCCGGCCGGTAYTAGCSGSMAYSCFGGPVQSYTPMFNGGVSCFGAPLMAAPAPAYEAYPSLPGFGVPPPNIPYAPPEVAPPGFAPERSSIRPAGYPGTFAASSPGGATSRATVIVRLPVDAKLYADGAALRMTGGERKFITPELPEGMEFTYRFTAEYERNGEVVSVSKKVVVRPGLSAAVEFADLTATKPVPAGSDAPPMKGDALAAAPVSLPKSVVPPVAPIAPVAPVTIPTFTPTPAPAPVSQPATITVKLPQGATLYVDDRKSASSESVRRFTTPPLPAGREFGYLLKAEVVRNGQPETLTQRVAFRAGEQLTVDLTGLGK